MQGGIVAASKITTGTISTNILVTNNSGVRIYKRDGIKPNWKNAIRSKIAK